jgi:hypothetical protein
MFPASNTLTTTSKHLRTAPDDPIVQIAGRGCAWLFLQVMGTTILKNPEKIDIIMYWNQLSSAE